MSNTNVIFGGGGGKAPAVLMWHDPAKDAGSPITVSRFSPGYSVYAMAVSPGATKLAAGTKAGLIRVYALSDFIAQENASPLFEIYHRAAVWSLAFCTDDILASGGMDGKILLWSISKKSKLAEICAHPANVFALRSLGTLAMASIGGDNILKIWDMDELICKFEGEPFVLPKIQAITNIEFCAYNGLLLHPSRDGNLHVYDTRNNFSKRLISAHKGDFGALACSKDAVATAGLDDNTIKIWSWSLDHLISQNSTSAPVLSLAWSGTSTCIAAYSNGSSQTWNVSESISPGPYLLNSDLRTVIGLPPDIIIRSHSIADKQWRDAILVKARDLMNQPDAQQDLAAIVNELAERGFVAEAALVLADTARMHNKPLWELETLMTLAEGLSDNPAAVHVLYALGNVLERINEPKLAIEFFTRITTLDPHYHDARNRIQLLASHRMADADEKCDIRNDLLRREFIAEEISKYDIINKRFLWRSVFIAEKSVTIKTKIDLDAVASTVLSLSPQEVADTAKARVQQNGLIGPSDARQVRWLYIPLLPANLGVAFAIELQPAGNSTELFPYAVFDPGLLNIDAAISIREHNQKIKVAWLNVLGSPHVKRSLATVHTTVLNGIKQLGGAVLAQTEDEF